MNHDSKLTPEQRKSIIEMYEKRMEDTRKRLNELRDSCRPHAYEIEPNGVWTKCIACGQARMYYPGMDLYPKDDKLPTIEKAPHALPG